MQRVREGRAGAIGRRRGTLGLATPRATEYPTLEMPDARFVRLQPWYDYRQLGAMWHVAPRTVARWLSELRRATPDHVVVTYKIRHGLRRERLIAQETAEVLQTLDVVAPQVARLLDVSVRPLRPARLCATPAGHNRVPDAGPPVPREARMAQDRRSLRCASAGSKGPVVTVPHPCRAPLALRLCGEATHRGPPTQRGP
jgi:hypothetical protein